MSEKEKNQKRRKLKPQNKARDVMTDYYRTGREYAKENAERYEKEGHGKSWSGREIAMLVVIILGAIGIVLKYFVF